MLETGARDAEAGGGFLAELAGSIPGIDEAHELCRGHAPGSDMDL